MSQVYQTIKNSSTKRLVIVDTYEELPPSAVVSALYFVRDGRRLYIWTGNGWLPIVTENDPPNWVNVPSSPLTVLLQDTYSLQLVYDDPEQVKGTFGFTVTSGSIGAGNSVTLDEDDIFTVSAVNASTFTLTFTASDGANEIEQVVEFILRLEQYFEQSEARLTNETYANSNLGVSIAVNDDYWAIGAQGYADPASNAGAVLLYKKQPNQFSGLEEWVFDTFLQPSDISGGQNFGSAVSLDRDYLVVGAKSHTSNRGKIYLFKNVNGTWTELDSVLGGVNELYGTSVDIQGNMLVAGAPGFSSNTGKVELYNISTDLMVPTNTFSGFAGLTTGALFGSDVAVDGMYDIRTDYKSPSVNLANSEPARTNEQWWRERNTTIEGDWAAIGDPVGADGSSAGSVAVYKKDSNGDWSLHSTLTSPEEITNGKFGVSVDISGDRMIVGEPLNTTNTYNTVNYGKAYVFKLTNDVWILEQTLSPSPPNLTHQTGYAVAISGDVAVLGHIGPNSFNLNNTYAFVYHLIDGVWEERGLLEDNVAGACLGEWVAVEGDIIAISTHRDGGSNYTGSVWIYERNQTGNWNRVFIFNSPDTLQVPDGINDNNPVFGRTVSISGNRVVSGWDGNYADSNYEPAIVIFEKSDLGAWSSNIYFIGKTAGVATNDYDMTQNSIYKMAQCVSIYEDYIAVGWSDADAGTISNGAVYIYKIVEDDVFLYTKINGEGRSNSHFGWHVSINENSLVAICAPDDPSSSYIAEDRIINFDTTYSVEEKKFVVVGGAPGDDSNRGAAWIFENTRPETWTGNETVSKIVGQYDSGGDQFGTSVSALDHYVTAGVPNSDIGNLNGGMGYIYQKNATGVWVEHTVCLPGDAPSNALFGKSCEMSYTDYPGEVSLPTAVFGALNAGGQGAVYTFRNTGSPDSFTEHRKIVDEDFAGNDSFGAAVSIYNKYVVSGATGAENLLLTVNNVGKAKLYRLG